MSRIPRFVSRLRVGHARRERGARVPDAGAAGDRAALKVQVPVRPPSREPTTLHTLFAGFRFVWQRKPVLGAVSLDLFAVLLGGATALLPIFAKDILHTGPFGLACCAARRPSARWWSCWR